MRRGWLSVFSMLAVSFLCLAAPLRAQFAYVANDSSNNVSAYSIGSNGALTPVPGSPFAAGSFPSSVAVDPTGKFAYVANANSNNVSAYRIGSNGTLTPVPGSPFAAGPGANSVAVDPTGKFAYVANANINNVSAYSIGSNGALTPVPGSPFAAGGFPSSVAVDPTGKFAYVANANTNNVSAYSIGSNGALTPVPGSPFAAGYFTNSIAVDPTGKFAYVAGFGPDPLDVPGTVSAYSIGSNGALIPVPGSPFAAGYFTKSIAVDPTGKFAYVASFGLASPGGFFVPSTVSAYSIGSNGALTPAPGSPFAAGLGATSVAITPLVPFATSFAKLKIAKQGFVLGYLFTLGAITNGINPLTQNLALQIGTFSVMIPQGSFKQIAYRIFVFQGVINGVDLSAQMVALGNNIFALAAESKGVNLAGLTNPVTVVLTSGDNSGSTAVTAQKEEKKERE